MKYHNETAPTAHNVHLRLAQLSWVRRSQLMAVPMAGTQGENGPRKACYHIQNESNNKSGGDRSGEATKTKGAKHRVFVWCVRET